MEQETPASYTDFISALEYRLARDGLAIEQALLELPALVSEDPGACVGRCLRSCEMRADAEGWILALRAGHRADVAADLIGPADRLGASLLSTFELVLEAAGDWYSDRLYRLAADGLLSWWAPAIEPFALAPEAPSQSL